MSPLSPASTGEPSGAEDPRPGGMGGAGGNGPASDSPDDADRPSRLQRAHGPSKKTFKFRRSRHTKPEVILTRFNVGENTVKILYKRTYVLVI